MSPIAPALSPDTLLLFHPSQPPTIHWAIHRTPAGTALIAACGGRVCALHFPDAPGLPHPLLAAWPRSRIVQDAAATAGIAAEVSSKMLGRPSEPLTLLVSGTPFQLKVWEALLAIPAGEVVTYGEIAVRIGHPAAHRAAASAIGANAIAYLIPCHRVIRSTGAMGGYRWGLPRKRVLLELEAREAAVV